MQLMYRTKGVHRFYNNISAEYLTSGNIIRNDIETRTESKCPLIDL